MSLIHLGKGEDAGNPGNPGSWVLPAVHFVAVLIYILHWVYRDMYPLPSKRDYATDSEVKKCTGEVPSSVVNQ